MDNSGTAGADADSILSVRVKYQSSKDFSLDVRFEASVGFTMLLGPSGSGKTTILNCIAGLIRPTSGRIALGSRTLFDSAARIDVPVGQRHLAYLFQTLALFPHMTVGQNVQYGIVNLPARERRERIMPLLDSFHIAHLFNSRPSEISGGERQRTALARSLVTAPELLLLDEPLSALDIATKETILHDLRGWNKSHGIPILYVTHSPEEAFAVGERVAVFEQGRVIATGTPQEVLRTPRQETIAQIAGFENLFDAVVVSLDERQGTMLCRLGNEGHQLEVPLARAEVGASVRIAIRAGDIIIAGEHPHALSAQNTFEGRVVDITRAGVKLIVQVESGVTFEIHITPSACDELQLIPNKRVWLVIKAYSCNLVEPRTPSLINDNP